MPNGGVLYWRIKQLEEQRETDRKAFQEATQTLEANLKEATGALENKVDRLIMTLVGFSLTIAGSAAAVILVSGSG